jgi:hypothetical protein
MRRREGTQDAADTASGKIPSVFHALTLSPFAITHIPMLLAGCLNRFNRVCQTNAM